MSFSIYSPIKNRKTDTMSKLKALLFSITKEDRAIPFIKRYLAQRAKEEATIKGARIKYVQEDAKMTVACFEERFNEFNHDDPKTKSYYHPSQIGQCQRKLAYQVFGAPTNGEASPQDLMKQHLIFEIGTYAHVMIQNLLQAAGILTAREVPVRCDKQKIIGHGDGTLRYKKGEDALLEIKTINARGFAKLVEPKVEHQMQTTTYMGLLGLDSTTFLYYDKDSAELKEYTFPFEKRRWTDEIQPRIARFHEAIEKRKLPPREGDDPKRFPCAWCEFSSVCFDSMKRWEPAYNREPAAKKAKLTIGRK